MSRLFLFVCSLFFLSMLSGFQCGPTVHDCVDSSDCSGTEQCIDYSCQIRDYCSSNQDCQAPRVCQNNKCTTKSSGCKTDVECDEGRTCQEGVCKDKPTASICKLSYSRTSVSFSGMLLQESKSEAITITNQADGTCILQKTTFKVLSDAPGKVSVTGLVNIALQKGEKATIKIDFRAEKEGHGSGEIEVFANNASLKTLRVYFHVKGDTSLPAQGWSVVRANDGYDSGYFIGGCFWDASTFEAVSVKPFLFYGQSVMSRRQGSLLKTTDQGKTWECVDCVSAGSGFPLTPTGKVYDLKARGMACGQGKAYVFGTTDEQIGTGVTSIFVRSKETTWSKVKNGGSNGEVLGDNLRDQLFFFDDTFYSLSGGMLSELKVETNSSLKLHKIQFMSKVSNGHLYTDSLEMGFGLGLILGRTRSFQGGRYVESSFIRLNLHGGKIDQNNIKGMNELIAEVQKKWKEVTNPCKNCTYVKARLLSKDSFLVMGYEGSYGDPEQFGIWLTKDQGSSWKRVFFSETKRFSAGDILAVDEKRVYIALGVDPVPMGDTDSEGLLLESLDGGVTFTSVDITTLKGKKLKEHKLKSLYTLRISADKKVVFALGNGVILRWMK